MHELIRIRRVDPRDPRPVDELIRVIRVPSDELIRVIRVPSG